MPQLYNKKAEYPKEAVYIGRPSIWGNPYEIGRDGNRREVLARYEVWLEQHSELRDRAKKELKGKDLICWCTPLACHGDILLKIANEGT